MADAPAGDMRSTILAELASGETGDAPAEVAPVEEAPAEDVEAAADDAELDASAEDESPLDEDAPSDEDEVELKSDDPKEQKLLDNVRRAEKRMREAAARRDAEFQAERQKWQQQVDRVAEIERMTARIKYDPISVLRALGVADDDLESLAQAAYAESPAGQKDPNRKQAAAMTLKERERQAEIDAIRREHAETREMLRQQQLNAQVAAESARYIADLNATAASKHPLVAHLLKADAEGTNDALLSTFDKLAAKLNRSPKPAEVVAAYDKAERARLTRLGIDPATIVKPKPAAAKPAPGAKPANGNTPKPAATNGAKKMTPAEERESILAELANARSSN